MDFHSYNYFKAYFSDGMIIMWHKPQSFTHVFKTFKSWGDFIGGGALFCGNRLIRLTGTQDEVDAMLDIIFTLGL